MTNFNQQFDKIKTQSGFIAALDQSGGSTPKALANYGVGEDAYSNDEEMYAVVHQMRSRIITSPSFNGDRILGAILFENTMDRDIESRSTADYLWEVKRKHRLASLEAAVLFINDENRVLQKKLEISRQRNDPLNSVTH